MHCLQPHEMPEYQHLRSILLSSREEIEAVEAAAAADSGAEADAEEEEEAEPEHEVEEIDCFQSAGSVPYDSEVGSASETTHTAPGRKRQAEELPAYSGPKRHQRKHPAAICDQLLHPEE